MSKSVAIIDGDGIIYSRATMAEVKVGEGEYLQLITPEQAYMQVVHEIESLMADVRCETALVCLSDSSDNCFRKKVYPPYKSNRKDTHRPKMLGAIRQLVLESDDGYGKLAIKSLEADDVCGISQGIFKEQGRRSIIVSPDKDLMTIPGKTWCPRPLPGGRKKPIADISEEEADREFLKQTLTGDTVDGYPGCPGIGKVKAEKALHNCYTLRDMWESVVECFEKKDLTEEDALTQARVARILRVSDWDAETKKVKLWEPPSE